ncbi:MAG: hypothetical protein ACYDB9_02080 [Gammaproteobacteria bacterium]
MIDTIKSVLSRTVSSQGFIPTMQAGANPESFQAQIEAARDRLRAAMMARDAAANTLAEAQAAVERVHDLISAADDAQQKLKDAEQASADFTKAWAESGAPVNFPSVDPKLAAQADAASRKAIAARIAAAGAEAGLQTANGALWEAKNALESAQEKVGYAVAKLLAALVEEHFARVQQAAAAIDATSHEIQSCCRAIAGHFYKFSADSLAAQLLSRLQAAMPAAPHPDISHLRNRGDELAERSGEFIKLGNRLLDDADAV